MNRNFSKTLANAVSATHNYYNLLQDMAVFCLKQAKDGNIEFANKLIFSVLNPTFFHPGYIIAWFESFGNLEWSNEKNMLVKSDSGRWLIGKAVSTKWYEISIKCVYRLSFTQVGTDNGVRMLILKDDFCEKIIADSQENFVNDSSFGKFGIPADNKRYNKYKIKYKRK